MLLEHPDDAVRVMIHYHGQLFMALALAALIVEGRLFPQIGQRHRWPFVG
ncbi:MAG: hypothetical protein K6G00_08230 [Treponema sp.]|nr:hypothetical protein [Treponema sp.]